ncbi:MAG: hypothetical protein K6T76_06155 [Alicyclobacillus mali]|nr:hypothetical protein [Alicyclobacillus mali (ex Roth et al. 2021)]
MELNAALLGFVTLHALEVLEEVEVPPRAAQFAIGDGGEPNVLLLGDNLADGVVFHSREGVLVDLAGKKAPARLLDRLGAEQAPHLIRAERRLVAEICV